MSLHIAQVAFIKGVDCSKTVVSKYNMAVDSLLGLVVFLPLCIYFHKFCYVSYSCLTGLVVIVLLSKFVLICSLVCIVAFKSIVIAIFVLVVHYDSEGFIYSFHLYVKICSVQDYGKLREEVGWINFCFHPAFFIHCSICIDAQPLVYRISFFCCVNDYLLES